MTDAKHHRITAAQAAMVELLVAHFLDQPGSHAIVTMVQLGGEVPCHDARTISTCATPLLEMLAGFAVMERALRRMQAAPEPHYEPYLGALASAVATIRHAQVFEAMSGSAIQ